MEMEKPSLIVNAFINNNGKSLAIKRARGTEIGAWETPGGRVDPGERAEDALIREIEEETGFKVSITKFLGWGQGIGCLHEKGNPTHRFILYFLCEIVSGEPKIDENEASEYRWVTNDEFRRLDPLSKPMKDFFDNHVL
jgi:8-oxo-dGTP diphosphatase